MSFLTPPPEPFLDSLRTLLYTLACLKSKERATGSDKS